MAPITRSQDETPAFPDVRGMMSSRATTDLGQEQPDEDVDSGHDDDEVQSETSIQDFLQPLQETAERVSQQVEDFASRVHRFKSDRSLDDDVLWEDAWGMLDDFHNLTKRRLANTGAGRPRAFSHRKSLGDTNAQTQKLQLEADLWILTKNLLMSNSPRAKADASEAQATELGKLHRYSTNPEFWNAFLDSDTIAQEYETTLAWLQERAEQNSPPIDNLIQNWTIESTRGDGLWSAGPMFTKNAIKKQKRDRAWALPLEPGNPSLNLTLRRQTDSQPVVTQLDPDASTRQGAFLEPQDEYHEQAAWLTCWELLRRGRPLSDIRAWWDERNEQWRSLLLRSSDSSSIDAVQSPWLRMMNLATNAEWYARCKALGKNEYVKDPFQQAVYGLLAGDASISNKVCETIDDYLFSEFNALLIGRYELYLQAYRRKSAGEQQYQVPDSGSEVIKRFVYTAQTNANLKDELHEPHKLIELALMERDFDSFFVRIGRAAAQIAYIDGDFGFKKLIARDNTPSVSDSALLTAQDEDSVRIVAHLQLVLQTLGLLQKSSEQNREQLENNIVNYIGWLQKDQKWSLLPVYASKLSPERTRHVLGQILIEVTNNDEREAQVRLLKKYNIDISEVIYGISSLATYHQMTKYKNGKLRFRAPRFTERAGPRNSEQTRIRTAFMGERPSEEDMKLIHSVEWYRWIEPDKWGYACHHISLLYKYWLFEGNYQALRELAGRCLVSQISISAVEMNLLYADESQDDTYSDDEDFNMNGADDKSPPKTSPRKKREQRTTHPLAREGTTRSHLYQKSLCWLQLEQLTLAIDGLERWQDYANDTIEWRHDPARVRTLKRELTESLEETIAVMEPLWHPDFLRNANDELEADALEQIRDHYFPECILGYNSVLFFAGHALSRTWLVQCMDLAQRVASNTNLTEAFVRSGRMKELVNVFAIDSQELLQANEQGKNRGGKVGKKEKGIDMWNVSWRDEGKELDLEAVD